MSSVTVVAALSRHCSRTKPLSAFYRNYSGGRANAGQFRSSARSSTAKYVTIVGAATGLLAFTYGKYTNRFGTVQAFTPKKLKDETEKAVKLTSRERRFIKFSSAEYDGQLYMTPQDFLDSVVEQEPRRKRASVWTIFIFV